MRSRLSRLLRFEPTAGSRGPDDVAASGSVIFVSAALEPEAPQLIGHDPKLAARDEAIFLLHTAAEIEHALLVQYLYAAYSLDPSQAPDETKRELVKGWRETILGIAREEMGHLASIQNLIRLIGGPLNMEREDFPFRSDVYPFHFTLQPLTKDSLAKYVFAEMPNDPLIPGYEEISERARGANMEVPLNHVGSLYKRMAELFKERTPDGNSFALADEDLQSSSDVYQTDNKEWGGSHFILFKVRTREGAEDGAVRLIEEIAKQGEGLSSMAEVHDSHYERLRSIYDLFPESDNPWKPSRDIPTNPNTSSGSDETVELDADLVTGHITNPGTRIWAQLFNARYRMLLMDLLHFFYITDSPQRTQLKSWIFEEMFINIKDLSSILMELPLRKADTEGPPFAGPPFELPYSLNVPDFEPDRWRLHRDMIIASQMLTKNILEELTPNQNQREYLEKLAKRDAKNLAIARNQGIPPEIPTEPVMNRFTEVKKILEDAVSGTDIGAHGNFWRNKTRDEFIVLKVFGQPLVAKKADGTFDENESSLVKALQGRTPFGSDIGTPGAAFRRMPAGLDPVGQDKLDFIRQWIKDGCPDEAPAPVPPVPSGTPLSFAVDIKGLFRPIPDRSAMLSIASFDLHKYEDVRDKAESILARLEDGSMPCDGGWPEDRIAKFRKWIEDGKRP